MRCAHSSTALNQTRDLADIYPKEPLLPSARKTEDWLALPEFAAQPLCMREDWIADFGPLPCAVCDRAIRPGEPFHLAGYCAMGGVVPAAQFALYADMLEPHAQHLDCANPIDHEPTHP